LAEVQLVDGELTKIGYYAFGHCGALETIRIPSSVKIIGIGAFQECDKLAKVQFGDGNLETIGQQAFWRCGALESIEIPSSVKVIGKAVFSHTEKLSTVTLYDGLESIGENAFSACPNLCVLQLPAYR
jgi:hypothetical protein